MKTMVFNGSSDDIVEVHDGLESDEYNNTNIRNNYAGSFQIHSKKQGTLRVHCLYDGCWAFAIGQADEDDAIPKWPSRVTQCKGVKYSSELSIDVPDDATLIPEGAFAKTKPDEEDDEDD